MQQGIEQLESVLSAIGLKIADLGNIVHKHNKSIESLLHFIYHWPHLSTASPRATTYISIVKWVKIVNKYTHTAAVWR